MSTTNTATNSNVINFVNSCVSITDCDTTSDLNKPLTSFNIIDNVIGDTNLWNTYFSCYKCTGNKIPTLHIKMTSMNFDSLEPYDPSFADGTNKFSG